MHMPEFFMRFAKFGRSPDCKALKKWLATKKGPEHYGRRITTLFKYGYGEFLATLYEIIKQHYPLRKRQMDLLCEVFIRALLGYDQPQSFGSMFNGFMGMTNTPPDLIELIYDHLKLRPVEDEILAEYHLSVVKILNKGLSGLE